MVVPLFHWVLVVRQKPITRPTHVNSWDSCESLLKRNDHSKFAHSFCRGMTMAHTPTTSHTGPDGEEIQRSYTPYSTAEEYKKVQPTMCQKVHFMVEENFVVRLKFSNLHTQLKQFCPCREFLSWSSRQMGWWGWCCDQRWVGWLLCEPPQPISFSQCRTD